MWPARGNRLSDTPDLQRTPPPAGLAGAHTDAWCLGSERTQKKFARTRKKYLTSGTPWGNKFFPHFGKTRTVPDTAARCSASRSHHDASLAQLVEQLIRNQQVAGSSPVAGSIHIEERSVSLSEGSGLFSYPGICAEVIRAREQALLCTMTSALPDGRLHPHMHSLQSSYLSACTGIPSQDAVGVPVQSREAGSVLVREVLKSARDAVVRPGEQQIRADRCARASHGTCPSAPVACRDQVLDLSFSLMCSIRSSVFLFSAE